ncbi:MAG: phosphoglycerate kinase [Legionellales bacterium]|nr:phosphoglycerate kinase [Legionellales bacterium]
MDTLDLQSVRQLNDVDLNGKTVLIRVDFNVPMHDGRVTNASRIEASLPTIRQVLAANAAVILLSHRGRPTEGTKTDALSLAPIAPVLQTYLQRPVQFINDWRAGVTLQPGEVALLENCRFNRGEKANDPQLAQQLAALADVFVMDAFGVIHRQQASTYGIAQCAPVACAGPLLCLELASLTKALDHPQPPMLAIVGGAKVSTKLTLLTRLLDRVDQLIVGGGIANTFIAAQGYSIGKSLYEADLVDEARRLLERAKQSGKDFPLPTDVVVAEQFDAQARPMIKPVDQVTAQEMILDIGPQTAQRLSQYLHQAKTIVWNGPVGVFEWPAFANGTQVLAQAIADSDAFSLAGGGDTIAAIDQFGVREQISYISTGGGAFLTLLEGHIPPTVKVLYKCADVV